jgi:hypothetical protein
MVMNALSAKKKILPRPAVCASKQKVFDHSGGSWLVPVNVEVTLHYDGGSGTPPEWFRDFTVSTIRQPATLRWHVVWFSDGINYSIKMEFDPVHGEWMYTHSEIDSLGLETAFVQIDIHEVIVPDRHASFTHWFPSPTGRYVDVTLNY